jgi:hypothetical protein
MRRYLLDTDPLAALLLGQLGATRLVRPWIRNQEAATGTLVFGEVFKHLKGLPGYALRYPTLWNLLASVCHRVSRYAGLDGCGRGFRA